MKQCIEWFKESKKECTEYRDEGYKACDKWDEKCCDWWPCSWACKLVTWVCVAWHWVANVVCVAWKVVTTAVCLVWEVVKIILSPFAFVIGLILAIPILGRLIREVLSLLQEIVWRIVGLADAVLTLVGIRLNKKLRCCIVILKDSNGALATDASLAPAIASAKQIFENAANVTLVVDGIHTVKDESPGKILKVECNVGALGEDLWVEGSHYEVQASRCFTSLTDRLVGYGATVVIFVVKEVAGAHTAGCSLGPLSSYVTIEGPSGVCLAHELAHACGLWHVGTRNNLAHATCGGTKLDWWQRIIVRNSRFVTYV